MSNYSLSSGKEKVFPESIEDSGKTYPVDADFRLILKIMRMLSDDGILETHKINLLCKWFFKGDIPDDGVNCFIRFLGIDGGGEGCGAAAGADESQRQFDFEVDAEEIFISFLAEYGVDLYDVGFLHYYKFRAMLSGLSETSAFKRKIQLRFKDLSGFKGKDLFLLQQAKALVALPEKLTEQEMEEAASFERMWGAL